MLAKESLSSSSSLRVTFVEAKCMIRMMYVVIRKRGSGRQIPPDVGMVAPISALLFKSTSNATVSSNVIIRGQFKKFVDCFRCFVPDAFRFVPDAFAWCR